MLSQRLRALRSEMKMTQKEFAEKIGFTQATLSAYENNQKKPSLDIVMEIAKKCNVSIDWLCGLSDRTRNDNYAETYGDVIQILADAWDAVRFRIIGGNPYYIAPYDDVLEFFFKDWSKILDLYYEGTIDRKLYDLWLTDKRNIYGKVHLYEKDEIDAFLKQMAIDAEKHN